MNTKNRHYRARNLSVGYLAVIVGMLGTFGCGAENGAKTTSAAAGETSTAAASSAANGATDANPADPRMGPQQHSQYYFVRQITPPCAAHRCGGYWVRAANAQQTRCSDGRMRPECFVNDLNFAALGLSNDELAALKQSTRQIVYRGVMQGSAGNHFHQSGMLAVDEAWQASNDDGDIGMMGRLYHVSNNGIVCITTPCFTMNAQLVNSMNPPVMLSALRGDDALVEGASMALGAGPVLVLGRIKHGHRNHGYYPEMPPLPPTANCDIPGQGPSPANCALHSSGSSSGASAGPGAETNTDPNADHAGSGPGIGPNPDDGPGQDPVVGPGDPSAPMPPMPMRGRALAVFEYFKRVQHVDAVDVGDPLACMQDSDCVFTPYSHLIHSSQECYPTCCTQNTILNSNAETVYQQAYAQYCSDRVFVCPMMCMRPPTIGCVHNQCVAIDDHNPPTNPPSTDPGSGSDDGTISIDNPQSGPDGDTTTVHDR